MRKDTLRKKLDKIEKGIKTPNRLSQEPRRAALEQKLFDAAERVKEEGING